MLKYSDFLTKKVILGLSRFYDSIYHDFSQKSRANQLTGFYMRAAQAFNELILPRDNI